MATPSLSHHRWTHYLAVWLALVGLTTLSFLLSLADLGAIDTVFSLVIAAAKSTVVLLFFMHLVEERFTVAVVPVLAFGYVLLLVALMATDVLSRHTFPRTPLPFGDEAGGLPDPAAGPGERP
jgi:cytochrome c oxidase subunit IV